MAVIEFRTLGALDLRDVDGHQLHSLLAQPKRMALLAYLCVANPGSFHRRDSLLGIFWPDADEAHARTSLRNALHVLRHSLGEAAITSRGDDEIAINSALVWCDAVAFEGKATSESAEGALDLYCGDFLIGFFLDDTPDFEHWVEVERARLRTLAARAARVSAELREKEQNLTDAITLARRAVQLTETDERATRRLIELLARAGDRAGALQAYGSFARHLADRLGAEPSDETRSVIERIRREQSVSGEARAAPPTSVPETGVARLEIPGYMIERELGRGGTSTVFVGRDLKHDRRVAIKVLRPDVAGVLGVDRFLSEISIASRLNHPHILPLLDSGKATGLPFYVMPYTDAETLRARIRREGVLSIDDAVQIAIEVADALGYAHALGVVHRDIKPENIVLEHGHALVTDFGIARALTQAGTPRLTQPGFAVGTAAYMSPEQADEGDRLDARADIYALASVLYEMLTGDPPFLGSTSQAILSRKMAEPVPPMRTVRETIPPSLERSVLKALARVQSDRFRSVQDFAAAIRTSSKQRDVRTLPIPDFLRHRWHHRSVRIVGMVIVVTMLGGTLLGLLRRDAHVTHSYPIARQITYSGRASRAAISPDGQYLAYTLAVGDSQQVVVQDLASGGAPNPVATITAIATMEWSPSGTQILFGSFDPVNSKGLVFTIPRGGGDPHKLAIAGSIGSGVYANWIPGGQSANPQVSLYADPDRRLLAADLQTGDTVPMLLAGNYDGLFLGAWSPSGAFFAASMRSIKPVEWEIGTFGRDGRSQVIVEDSVPLGALHWSAKGDALYYARGSSSIWRVPVSVTTGASLGPPQEIRRDLELLTNEYNGFATFGMTRDGHRLVYPRGRRYSNIWSIGKAHSAPIPLTTGTALRWSPAVSPDGKWLAFAQEIGEGADLFRMPVGGGPTNRVTFGANVGRQMGVAWSPDGKSLAYGSVRNGRSQVWIASVESGQAKALDHTYLTPYQGHISWAPASRIAYLNSSQTHIELVDPSTGDVRTIVPNAKWSVLQSPEYSPDGKAIAVAWNRGAGDFGVWIFDVAGLSPPRKIADGWLWPKSWSPDGRYVYANRYDLPTLFRVDTRETSRAETVISATTAWRGFDLSAPVREMQCTVAGRLNPEGFICTVFDFVSDIWIVDNFDPSNN